MKQVLLISLFYLVNSLAFRNEAYEQTVTYIGAVMEYEPYKVWTDNKQGFGIVRTNVEAVISAAKIAKLQNADILVAPEGGLTGLLDNTDNLTRLLTYTTYIPNPWDGITPCDSVEGHPNVEGLKLLSCAAKEEMIYIAVNLAEAHPCSADTIAVAPWSQYNTYAVDDECPEGGFYIHNTEIVFDRTGTIIARYRKIHLFGEDFFTPGLKNDTSALFVTDFNVPFSLQICFDIAFEDPAYNNVKNRGIKDVITSTAWVDYLPFNTADFTQNAWSRGLDVNLLISGYHLPEDAKMGSGIYRYLFDEPPVYIFDKDSGNVLLVAEVKTTIETTNKPEVEGSLKHIGERIQDTIISLNSEEVEERTHVVFHENLNNYSRVILESGDEGQVFNVDVCGIENFCCNLTYQYTGNLTYMLIALKGHFTVAARYRIGAQNCAVIWCKSDNINSCGLVDQNGVSDEFGPFSLSSSSFTIDSIFPGGGHRDLTLFSKDVFHYTVEDSTYTVSSDQPIKNLYISFLFGRWYDNDETPSED